jgi:hypothetical protein
MSARCEPPIAPDYLDALVAEVAALRAEVERLRGALEWYADHTRYNGINLHQATNDAGYRARAALAKEPGNEG